MTVISGLEMPRRWIEITDADCAAAVAAPAQFFAALHNNAEYIKAGLYGEGSYVGAYPHDHDGAEDAAIAQSRGFNLLVNSAPWAGETLWFTQEVTGDWLFDRKITKVSENGFLFNGVEGATAQQICPPKGADPGNLSNTQHKFYDICKSIYGGDARMTVSLYAKLVTHVPTVGSISFGMSDGETNFAEDCRATFHWSDLSTSWQRFYAFVTLRDIRDGARFIVVQTEAQDCATYITAMQVSPGHRLTYWEPGRLDKSRAGDEHANWTGYGIKTVPLWEKATSITNAIKLEAV